MTPDLSVIVVASWSAEAVAKAVSLLVNEDVEVIITSAFGRVLPSRLPNRMRWIVGRTGDGVPELRRLGASASQGRVVAFLEDACVVTPGWVGAIRDGFRSDDLHALTGPVEQDPRGTTTDWAVYFAEYAPFAASPTGRLAGPNFACLRAGLDLSRPIREHEIAARTTKLGWSANASVTHIRRYSRREAIRDRFQFGREFGRERWIGGRSYLSSLGLFACPAILGVQLARLAVCLARSPRLIRPFLGSALFSLILLTAWSVGEAAGWAATRRNGSRRCGTAGRPTASEPDQAGSRPADCSRRPDFA